MSQSSQQEGDLADTVRVQMTDTVLADPSAFDAYAYTHLSHLPDGEGMLPRLRRAHMSLLRMAPDEMRAALLDLSEVRDAPAHGLRLMLQVTLGDAEGVAQAGMPAGGHTLLELENTCHSAAAIGNAHAMLSDWESAESHLLVAKTLATALNLGNRCQNLAVEWARVSALRGRPRPDLIEEQLVRPMPPVRRAWGQRTLAESFMGLGCYSDALRALGTPERDLPLDRALRNFISQMLALPVHPELDPQLPYAQLALALGRMHATDYDYSLVSVDGDPTRAYAAILEAAALTRSGGLAQQAVRALGRSVFAQPDLSLYRLVVLMWAVAEGATLHGGAFAGREAPLTDQLQAALNRLRRPDDVMRLLRRLGPDQYALLLFSPIGDLLAPVGAQGLSYLCGKHILTAGDRMVLPGRTGTVLVLEAMGLPVTPLTREERARYRRATESLSSTPVNLGWVVQALLRLSASAARLGHPNEAAAWRQSHARAMQMLHSETLDAIRKAQQIRE